MPSKLLGRQAHTVPAMARMVQTTIKLQSQIFCFTDRSSPKILRWKAHGRMMQMLKQAMAPISAMTTSNEGMNTAMMTTTTIVKMRMTIFMIPRQKADIPASSLLFGMTRASRPQKISTVVKIGRALDVVS